MKKIFVTILSILLLVTTSLTAFSACGKKSSEYVSYTVQLNKEGKLKILQLTDTHFINSDVTSKNISTDYSLRDVWAEEAITSVVAAADPDLIIVTGDSIFTLDLIKMFTGTNDNYEAFKKFAKFIDSFDIPWLFLFGNHDEEGELVETEGSADAAKKVLGNYLKSDEIKNCMYDAGPEEINGQGNYIVNVLNKDKSVNTSLVLMDSGSYIKVYDESTKIMYADQRKYEYVHDDQLDWYEKAIRDISDKEGHLVPSIIFQHIPFPQYQTLINSYTEALEALGEDWRDTINADWVYGTERKLQTDIGEIIYHGGVCNEENREVCCSYVGEFHGVRYDGGHEFDRILSLGSTKYVFCGHDHRNTFSFTYKGVRLSYGMSIDYSANGIVPPPLAENQDIYDEIEQRGGLLISIDESAKVTIGQVPFTRNLYQEALAAKA